MENLAEQLLIGYLLVCGLVLTIQSIEASIRIKQRIRLGKLFIALWWESDLPKENFQEVTDFLYRV